VESQPSGALVKVGGQALGLTPLSTLLPIGTQQLSISKQGYLTEQAFVQVDAAPHGAKAVRTRVVLQENTSDAPSAQSPQSARSRPTPPPRPSTRRAAARRAPEAPREEEPAPVSAAPPLAETPRLEPNPAASLLDEQQRARLLDDQSRARILD
jgi:hypothetical protein